LPKAIITGSDPATVVSGDAACHDQEHDARDADRTAQLSVADGHVLPPRVGVAAERSKTKVYVCRTIDVTYVTSKGRARP
jgi:hypothetical protein